MNNNRPFRIKTINEFHRVRNLSKPLHPLISVVNLQEAQKFPETVSKVQLDFYSISLRRDFSGLFRYGQREYDYDEGAMFFMAPNQIFSVNDNPKESAKASGWKWVLLIHPDLIWNTSLAKTIRKYEFFNYSVNEALFLSEKEEQIIDGIIANIEEECKNNIDKFSKHILISHIETLLNYAERFYNRQFITRNKAHHQVLERLEILLTEYFNRDSLTSNGLPSVHYIAQHLNISPNYLGSLLKVLTGQTTQQHIHEKLIEKAKEKLSTTDLSISQIAYELGFEHLQSFTKLFRNKTNLSPSEFRQLFN